MPIKINWYYMSSTSLLLQEAFERMFKHFGPRHWWPGETPFEVMVGAILTQNTNWKNVERAITNLKNEDVLSPLKLYHLQPERLAELIKPAGYFRIKTDRLRNFLKFFIEKYDANVENMRELSQDYLREELLSVKGIGPETADSIILYAVEKPIFVIDAYTKRIMLRHNLCFEEDGYNELQEMFMSNLQNDVKFFNEYHALIVETGKEFCRKEPLCENCPLNGWNLA